MASPIITAPSGVPGHSLWFGRAKLFEDKIVITGWEWTGSYRQTVPLDQIDSARWLPREDYCIVLYMKDDSRRLIDVKVRAGLWYWELRSLLDSMKEDDPIDSRETTQ